MIRNLFKVTTGLVVSTSLLAGIAFPYNNGNTTAADLSSQVSTIKRVYDKTNGSLLRYHYEDTSGNTVSLSSSQEKNTTSLYSKKASNIPESYDLRTKNLVTSIKDQGVTGSCWAFAAIKSMESSNVLQNLQTLNNADLSESHLAWFTYHPSTNTKDPLYGEGLTDTDSDSSAAFMNGGSALLAEFTLAKGSGAVTEATAPFSGDTTGNVLAMADSLSSKDQSLRYKSTYRLADASCYDDSTRDQIKEAIMNKGAMDVAFYYNSRYAHTTSDKEIAYYQTAYTDTEDAILQANHCVTIVGWDDNYSKANFGTNQPSSNGAWLIANSYGKDYGKDGYFWLSYEDPSLNEYYTFTSEKGSQYDTTYQYDAFGWGNAICSNTSTTSSGANIFTTDIGHNQTLKAVGIYTVSDNQPYTIKIYKNVTAGQPTSGTLAATVSGTEAYQGYHTISLNKTVGLNAGERFSVVLEYEQTSDTAGYIPIEGDSDYDMDTSLVYSSNAGESYFYTSSGWLDTNLYGTGNIRNNVCIKAFATNSSAVGSISLSSSKVTLGKGETYKPTATVKGIVDKSVAYSSSNKSVATVNSSGKITAKKAGTAKITAKILSGKTATLTVTVKKAPAKITTTPSKKKVLKKGKSFTIKTKLSSGSASNKLTFTSSKKKVATVTGKGVVTGKKKGTATITVKTYNNKKATIKVTVK